MSDGDISGLLRLPCNVLFKGPSHRFCICHEALKFCSLGKVQNALHVPRITTSWPQKAVWDRQLLHSWLANVLRYHSFDIATFKVVWACGALICFQHLASKCASRAFARHACALFWTSQLSTVVRAYLCAHLALPFPAPVSSFYWLFLWEFSLTLPTSAASPVHIGGSLTLTFLRLWFNERMWIGKAPQVKRMRHTNFDIHCPNAFASTAQRGCKTGSVCEKMCTWRELDSQDWDRNNKAKRI